MAIGSVNKFFTGFGFGVLFILLSGIFYGGILFANLLPNFNSSFLFVLLGIPYGFAAGITYLIYSRFRDAGDRDVVRNSLFFGIGFWLSFLSLYVFGYLAFSNFGF